MSDDLKAKIIERAGKLLSLASDGAATPGEVHNALAALERLLDQHGMTRDDIERARAQPDEAIGVVPAGTVDRMWARWREVLASGVADLCEVRCFIRNTKPKSVHFFGFKRDAAVASELFPILVMTAKTMARVTYGTGWTRDHESYVIGFVQGILEQVKITQARRAHNPTTERAIVLRDKAALIAAWAETNLKLNPARRRPPPRVEASAFNRGMADGSRVNLEKDRVIR